MQLRQRKMMVAQHQQMMNTHQMQTNTSARNIQQQKTSNTSTSTEESMSSSISIPPTFASHKATSIPTFGIGDLGPEFEDCPTPISPDQQQPESSNKQFDNDPRYGFKI